jgi:hypothetical protein
VNVYYEPEEFGLCQVAEIDRADSGEYDKFVVWKSKTTKTLYCGEDSG